MFRRALKRLLTPPMIMAAALYLWLEEWLWETLAPLMARLARLPAVRAVEAKIAALPPWGAAPVFLLPGLLLLPVKVAALFLMGKGHFILGAGVIVAAKALGTALAARLYVLCRPSLLTVGWFRRAHDWVLQFKKTVRDKLEALPAWRAVKRLKAELRAKAAAFWRRFAPRAGLLARRWRAVGVALRKRHRRPSAGP